MGQKIDEMFAAIIRMGVTLDSNTRTLEQINLRIGFVENRIAHHDERFEEVGKGILRANVKSERLSTDFNGLGAKLRAIEDQIKVKEPEDLEKKALTILEFITAFPKYWKFIIIGLMSLIGLFGAVYEFFKSHLRFQ